MTHAWICSSCDKPAAVWIGKCPACGLWGTIVKSPSVVAAELAEAPLSAVNAIGNARHALAQAAELAKLEPSHAEPELPDAVPITEIDVEDIEARYITRIPALDDVLGGGLVIGTTVVIGGDPGIGKSTLLIQAAASAARWNELRVLYAAGEESIAQIAMRAKRVGALYDRVFMVAETDPVRILELARKHDVEILIVDSISTMAKLDIPAAPGSSTQVRACAELLCAYAKETGTSLVLIAHVTKDGLVAGPNTLKHLVDTVVHFDAVGETCYRTLKAHKNRNGDTSVRGDLEMTPKGLITVEPVPASPTLGSAAESDQDSPRGLASPTLGSAGESDENNACAHLYDNGACTMCGELDAMPTAAAVASA